MKRKPAKKPAVKPKKGTATKPAQPGDTRPVPTLICPFPLGDWGYEMPALDIAEQRAKVCELEATQHEKRGEESAAIERRKTAADWRGMAQAKLREHTVSEWESIAAFHIDALLVRAQADCKEAQAYLTMIVEQANNGIHALAAHGNAWAARYLAAYLGRATDSFNLLADTKPELFGFLNEYGYIPGMISPRNEKTADNARLCEKLGVGTKCELAVMPTGKRGRTLSYQTPANALALRLQSYIEEKRDMLCVIKPIEEQAGRELPEWLKSAEKLAPFSARTCDKWAEVAWQLLASESPDGCAENHAVFKDKKTWGYVVKGKSKAKLEDELDKKRIAKEWAGAFRWKKKEDRTSPSIPKHDIYEALRGGFATTAKGITERTKQRKKKEKPRKPA